MILQPLCAGGIWITCGKDFEKETIISCIYHKFQMVYSGITVQNQTVHWWNGNNFSGKSHLNCLIILSAANSLMFIMSLIRLVLIFFFPKARFLGSWIFGGCQNVYELSVFTQSAAHGPCYATGEREFFFFKDVLVRYLNIQGLGRSIMWKSAREYAMSGSDVADWGIQCSHM